VNCCFALRRAIWCRNGTIRYCRKQPRGNSEQRWVLGSDLRHFINVIHDLSMRSIGFKVLTGHGASIDTTTSAGKLVFRIFASLAEFERDLISERTKAGFASARARGRKGGAPYNMTAAKVRMAMAAMGQKETKVADLCSELKYLPANALPACRAGRHATQGRAESR
jgi:DNA invertase Pin-like site-specific DNA recombinase